MDMITVSNSLIDALGWTLLHAVWQGFALVLPAAILLHLLRHRSSALRYRVGVAGLLAQVLASVATFGYLYTPATSVPATALIANAPAQTLPLYGQILPRTLPWFWQTQQFMAAHLNEFVLLYLIGVLVFALRLAGGWLYLQRLTRTAAMPASDRLITLTESLRSVMQLGPVVHLRESARVAVPMIIGVLKPILLLPVGLATSLSMAEVEAILAHELAHVKRHDYVVNLLQSVVEVLYFFHPALWWLSARVREEREHCCDDLAVKTIGGDGKILAQALAHVEEFRLVQLTISQSVTPTLAMAATNKRQLLLHRVQRVLGVPMRAYVSNGSLAGLTLATLVLLSVSVYAVQQPQPKPKAVRKSVTMVTRDNTTVSVADKKINSVVWKGQKLPATRIARLQKLYDQVMAGQLNLDDVKQPDRNILLEIVEADYSADKDMNTLNEDLNADLNAQGSARIDYNTIMKTAFDAANSAGTFPVNVDDVLDDVKKIDYNSIIGQAMSSISQTRMVADSIVEPSIVNVIRRQDSLADVQDLNRGKVTLLKAQAQMQEFAVDAVERRIERLERQKYMLDRQRSFETRKQQQAISESGYADSDSLRNVLVKKIGAGEAAIQKVEAEIEKMNQQLMTTLAELEKAQKPLQQTETELRKLRASDYEAFAGPNALPRVPRLPKAIHGTPIIKPVPPVPATPRAPRPAPAIPAPTQKPAQKP